MSGVTRWNPFEEMLTIQREVDRLFNQFWNDLPTRTAAAVPGSVQVNATEEGWRIDVPMPGIDPQHVQLDVAGNTLSIRADVERGEGRDSNSPATRYEQTLTLPPFLDVDKLSASHRHGMLQLSLPLKESVKPRRVQIAIESGDQKKQLTAA